MHAAPEQPPIIAARRREILSHLFGGIVYISFHPKISSASNLPSSTGADLSQTRTVDALVPIVAMLRCLEGAKMQLTTSSSSTVTPEICSTILQSLKDTPREEKSFKRLFDAYSTPVSYKQKFLDQNAFLVYYSKGFDGPGRPVIEEGDVNEVQTLQYGARNDAWSATDELFVELEYGKGLKYDDSAMSSMDELVSLFDKALVSFDNYLSLAPMEDVKAANRQLNQ